MTTLTQSRAWEALKQHHAEVKDVHLRDLFAKDEGRGTRFAVEACGLYADFSKQRITSRTLELLLSLAAERALGQRIEAMFKGERINVTEDRAVLHVALRAPKGATITVDGTNVVPLVHQVLVAYAAAGRAGTKAQLTKAEVRGGGKKPWRQKGTGQARAGSIRSPLWVGGGRAFAAKPRSYAQKVNRKMYRGAIRSMLSELARQERLVVTGNLELEAPKTRMLVGKLAELGLDNVLILVEAYDEKLHLAARNLPHVDVVAAAAVDPLSLARHDKVLLTVGALKMLEERLA